MILFSFGLSTLIIQVISIVESRVHIMLVTFQVADDGLDLIWKDCMHTEFLYYLSYV